MPTPIFEYSVTRPFQKKGKIKAIKKIIDSLSAINNSNFFQTLKSYRDQNDRDKMQDEAVKYRESNEYITDLKKLRTPLLELGNWLPLEAEKITFNDLESRITELFKLNGIDDWKSWIQDNEYKNEIGRLHDSLIASTINSKLDENLVKNRSKLLNAIRIIKIIELVADNSNELKVKNGVQRVLKSIVILPKEIFPLPKIDIKAKKEAILQKYEDEKKKIETRRKGVFNLVKTLENLNKTKVEIIKLHKEISVPQRKSEMAKKLNELDAKSPETIKTTRSWFGIGGDRTENEFDPKNYVEEDETWILTNNSIEKLSENSKNVLNGMNKDLNKVHVRDTVLEIESKINEYANVLHTTKPKTTSVRIGNNFISGSLIRPLDLPGMNFIQPGRGTIDVLVPTEPESPVLTVMSVPVGNGNVNPIGFSDLFIVNEEVQKYEAGEVAHIENVLKGEKKKREHKRTSEREEIFTVETEQIEESERDLQTSDRFELQTNSESAMQQTLNAEAGIEGRYTGPNFEIKANAGVEFERATQESTSKARNVAHEVVERTVSRISERVREERIRRTREVIEELNLHKLNNSEDPDGHIVGIYQWVNKIHKAEIVNFGKRLMFEFIVPEPAAFYLYAQNRLPQNSIDEPEPPVYNPTEIDPNNPFNWNLNINDTEIRPLQPSDLNDYNYQHWVSKYNVPDVEPPPPIYQVVGTSINEKPTITKGNTVLSNTPNIQVPDGYEALSAYIGGSFIRHPGGYFRIGVGSGYTNLWSGSRNMTLNNEVREIPIGVCFYKISAIGLTVEVTCEATPALKQEWQLKTYTAIMNAYREQKRIYEEQKSAAAISGGISIQGRNPLTNREIERKELKKTAISIITGQNYELFDAMRNEVPPNNYPELDLEEAKAEGKYMQFFEQAFEWHNISYFFYPYFWSRKNNWITKTHQSDTDPLFEKFLQAGAARVLVPVRPGYEEAILHYLETEDGEIWEGADTPHIDDDLYVSIVDSIREDHKHFSYEGTGVIDVKQNDRFINGRGTEFSDEDDENREIIIQGKKFRIAKIISSTEIKLDRPFDDNDANDLKYELGLKYVGKPWEVKIPTSLVILKDNSSLPDFSK